MDIIVFVFIFYGEKVEFREVSRIILGYIVRKWLCGYVFVLCVFVGWDFFCFW